MSKIVYLVCGVSGSGKSWVCRQLSNKFNYVPHDEHYHEDLAEVFDRKQDGRPFITECPFGETKLRADLIRAGFTVRPYFVVEHPDTVIKRFREREGRDPDKGVITRATKMGARADEWKAFKGTSKEVLRELLKKGNV